ncbi:AzlC-like membrane protein [Citrobacter koseri]|nr:AzlC-like membrane protein [Citrobacter koseri]
MKHHLSCLSGDTIKAIFLVCLAVGVVGMSYGSLAMAYGFPIWVPFVLSIFVLAGASEFMFIGIVASGGNPLAAAAAGLLVNARHIPFGVTVRELVGTRAASFLGCHIMNDESVVFGLSQKTRQQRKAAYWLCGAGVRNFLAAGRTAWRDGRQTAPGTGNHRSGCGISRHFIGVSDPGVQESHHADPRL